MRYRPEIQQLDGMYLSGVAGNTLRSELSTSIPGRWSTLTDWKCST